MPKGLLQNLGDDDDSSVVPPVASTTNTKNQQQQLSSSTSTKPQQSSNLEPQEEAFVLGGKSGLRAQSNTTTDQNNDNNSTLAASTNFGATTSRGPDISVQVQRLLAVNKPFILPGFVAGAAAIGTNVFASGNEGNDPMSPSSKNTNESPTTPVIRRPSADGRFPLERQNSFGGGGNLNSARGAGSGVPSFNLLTATNNNQQQQRSEFNQFNQLQTLTSQQQNANFININHASPEELASLFEDMQSVRIRTAHVAIIVSLHDGLDPRTIMVGVDSSGANGLSQRERAHTARLECWRDPLEFDTASSGGTGTMASGVAQALADQYRSLIGGSASSSSSSGGPKTYFHAYDPNSAINAVAANNNNNNNNNQPSGVNAPQQQQGGPSGVAPRGGGGGGGGALFHYFADATDHDIEKGLMNVRRKADESLMPNGRNNSNNNNNINDPSAPQSRIIVHYNGHGMITSSDGDLYFPNVTNTHFVPMSMSHFSNCVGSPVLYVFDCDRAGGFAKYFERNLANNPRHSKDILLCACASNEELPRNPGYPMDLFTSCLTTPLRTLLLWSAHNNALLGNISATAGAAGDSDDEEDLFYEMEQLMAQKQQQQQQQQHQNGDQKDNIDHHLPFASSSSAANRISKQKPLIEQPFINIPGSISDRKTPLGELQLILTALIDMIAWSCVTPEKFYQYFRGDTLTRHLVRNFLLADRILREFGRRPVSYPPIAPEARQHPLWGIWDVVLDGVLCQMPAIQHDITKYRSSSFFPDQLTAFATWLEVGDVTETNAEQLPCVMFSLQKPSHYRDRALLLLGKFFETGKTAVFRGLACGALQYLPLVAKSSNYQPNLLLLNAWHQLLRVLPRINLDENEQRMLLSILRLSPNDCRLVVVSPDGEDEEQMMLQRIPTSFSQLQQEQFQQQHAQLVNTRGGQQVFSTTSASSANASSPLLPNNNNYNNTQPAFGAPTVPSTRPGQKLPLPTAAVDPKFQQQQNAASSRPKPPRPVLTSASLSLTKGRTYATHMLCTLLGYGKLTDEDIRMVEAGQYLPSGTSNNNNNGSDMIRNNNQQKELNSAGSPISNNNNNNNQPSFLNIPDINNENNAHGFWTMRLFSTAYPLLKHEEESLRSWACLLLGCLLAYLPAARERLAARLFENSSDELFFSLLSDTSPAVRASCVFLLTKLIGSRLDNLDQDALQRRIFLERLIMQRLFESFSEVSRLVRREILFAASSVLFHYGSLLPEMLMNVNERGADAVRPEWKAMSEEQFKRVAFSFVSAEAQIRLPPSGGKSTISSHLTASGERAPITEIDNEALHHTMSSPHHPFENPNIGNGMAPPMMHQQQQGGSGFGGGSNNITPQYRGGPAFPPSAQIPPHMQHHHHHHHYQPPPNSGMMGGGPGSNGPRFPNMHHHHHHSHHHNSLPNQQQQQQQQQHQLPQTADQLLQNSKDNIHMCLSEILLRDLKDVVWDAAVLLSRAKASSDPQISEQASRLTARMTNEVTCRTLPRSTRARAAGLALLEETSNNASENNTKDSNNAVSSSSEAARQRERRNEDLARLALFHAEETGSAFVNAKNKPVTTTTGSSTSAASPTSTMATSSSSPQSPVIGGSNSNNNKQFPVAASTLASPAGINNNSTTAGGAGGSQQQPQQYEPSLVTAAGLAQSSTVEVTTFNTFSACGVNSTIRTGAFRLLEPHIFVADYNPQTGSSKLHVVDYDRLDEPQKLFNLQLNNNSSAIHSIHIVNDLAPNVACILVNSAGVVSMYGGFFSTAATSYTQPTPWQVSPLLSFNSATAFRAQDTGYTQWSGISKRNEYLPSCFRQRDGLFCISPVLNKIQCVSLQEEKTSQILHLSCESQCSVITTDPMMTTVGGGLGAGVGMMMSSSIISASSANQKLYCGFADGTVRLYDQRQAPGSGVGGFSGSSSTSSGGASLNLMCVLDTPAQKNIKPSFNIKDPLAIRHISVVAGNENLLMTSSVGSGLRIWDLRKRQCVVQMYDTPAFSLTSSSQQQNQTAQGSLVNAVLSSKQNVVCACRGNGGVELFRLDANAVLTGGSRAQSALSSLSAGSQGPDNNNNNNPYQYLGSASATQIGLSSAKAAFNPAAPNSQQLAPQTPIIAHPLKPFFAVGNSIVCATNSKQRLKVTTMSM